MQRKRGGERYYMYERVRNITVTPNYKRQQNMCAYLSPFINFHRNTSVEIMKGFSLASWAVASVGIFVCVWVILATTNTTLICRSNKISSHRFAVAIVVLMSLYDVCYFLFLFTFFSTASLNYFLLLYLFWLRSDIFLSDYSFVRSVLFSIEESNSIVDVVV